MSNEKISIQKKWYDFLRAGITREYVAGIIAGFGAGIMILSASMKLQLMPPYWTIFMFSGIAISSIGSTLARNIQRSDEFNSDEKGDS